MADKKKMSVEEILAAARRADGDASQAPSDPSTESAAERPDETVPDETVRDAGAGDAAAESAASETSASTGGKKPGQMSVEEMLAAARAEKAGGAKPAKPAEKSGGSAAKPAAASGAGKKPGQMSVEEMLAAARAEKAAGGKPAASKPAASKPAAKPAAAKPAAKAAPAKAAAKPAPAKSAGPKDTASILAAARKQNKPGPITKAEAAQRGAAVAPRQKPERPAKQAVQVPPMPAKPDYAKPRPARAAAAPESTQRRNFMAGFLALFLASPLALGFSTLAVTNLLWLLGLARFMFPNILTEPPTKFKVGFPDDYAPGQVEEKFKAQFGVWIVRYEYEGEPQIYALRSVCTHLGCTPNWLDGEQKFKCPCHGSGFYKDGINFEGPAPRPLERYAIRIADDGQLEVDKSRKFNEELGQWADPSSAVPV